MGLTEADYRKAIEARRRLQVADCPAAVAKNMKTLSDAGWDGDYVVPNQLSSRSLSGPVILLNNWFGWRDLANLDPATKLDLKKIGYLRGIPTNWCLDRALEIAGLNRGDIYITQACVFLPETTMGSAIPKQCYKLSVDSVLKFELGGRKPVALGSSAQKICADSGIDHFCAHHPSYQAGERRAHEIAEAIKKCRV